MPEGGFFEQKRTSPTSFAIVLALHGAAIGALAMAKMDPPAVEEFTRILVEHIPLQPDPPPVPEPKVEPAPSTPTRPTFEEPVIKIPIDPVVAADTRPLDPPKITDSSGPLVKAEPLPPMPKVVPPAPVRVEAEFDPRYAHRLQPTYPASEERAGNEGRVTVRLRIGADGRVKAVEKVAAASDAFFRATERQALAHWRFRPATLDGRPIASSKVLSVTFRLDN
jgi:protein TonB